MDHHSVGHALEPRPRRGVQNGRADGRGGGGGTVEAWKGWHTLSEASSPSGGESSINTFPPSPEAPGSHPFHGDLFVAPQLGFPFQRLPSEGQPRAERLIPPALELGKEAVRLAFPGCSRPSRSPPPLQSPGSPSGRPHDWAPPAPSSRQDQRSPPPLLEGPSLSQPDAIVLISSPEESPEGRVQRQRRAGLEMGALARTLLCPCRLLLLLGVFLLLLCLSSRRLQLSLSACVLGGHPCPWFGETLPGEEEEEEHVPGPAPTGTPKAPLPLRGEEFDIRRLQRAFMDSLTPRGEILLQEYLCGWRQLIKFMDVLGNAFGLISQETQSKITIMQQHQDGQHGLHYRTVQSMVNFELASGLVGFQSLPADWPPSGCRTLLRLHRALKWLELFLHKLGTSQKDDKPSQMCMDAYREALAPYHSWWVRQAAALAFLAMPSHQELYRIIIARQEKQAAWAIVMTTVESLGRVYNITQDVFSAHGMLQLP
ncbi:glycolipid transfer protein domain-containing protein 2 isoform X2 [Candoia aspera]|uniref:glycolipid transfer protein domain-containing protein 2 isoform X2 n=1 Tax=Candoia aspera TaxID=51853 RepID=UPI002FD863D0